MIILGRYFEIYKSEIYPNISDDIHHPCKHKDAVLKYMKKCISSSCAPAVLTDVFTGESMEISLEFKSDGIYGWRTDYIYYIEKYDLKIPEDFVDHVINEQKSI